MSLNNLMRQPVVIHKFAAAVDEYGNTVPNATSASVAAVGYLEQKDSVETLEGRDTVVSAFQAWFPVGTPLNAFDRLSFGAQSFEVDGEPWQVYNPRTGVQSHIIAKLKVVVGG